MCVCVFKKKLPKLCMPLCWEQDTRFRKQEESTLAGLAQWTQREEGSTSYGRNQERLQKGGGLKDVQQFDNWKGHPREKE